MAASRGSQVRNAIHQHELLYPFLMYVVPATGVRGHGGVLVQHMIHCNFGTTHW